VEAEAKSRVQAREAAEPAPSDMLSKWKDIWAGVRFETFQLGPMDSTGMAYPKRPADADDIAGDFKDWHGQSDAGTKPGPVKAAAKANATANTKAEAGAEAHPTTKEETEPVTEEELPTHEESKNAEAAVAPVATDEEEDPKKKTARKPKAKAKSPVCANGYTPCVY
jgi:hypothetical protein